VKVTQGAQSRFFSYDKLKRLVRVRTPEQEINTNLVPALTDPVTGNNQWCAKYVYDANSNLLTKTDARDIITTYTYDALNRITNRSYSANDPQSTPSVTYTYDAQPTAPRFSSWIHPRILDWKTRCGYLWRHQCRRLYRIRPTRACDLELSADEGRTTDSPTVSTSLVR